MIESVIRQTAVDVSILRSRISNPAPRSSSACCIAPRSAVSLHTRLMVVTTREYPLSSAQAYNQVLVALKDSMQALGSLVEGFNIGTNFEGSLGVTSVKCLC